jgi:hypothetical protein
MNQSMKSRISTESHQRCEAHNAGEYSLLQEHSDG